MVDCKYTDAHVWELVSCAALVRNHLNTWLRDTWGVESKYFQMKLELLDKSLEIFEETG